MRKILTCAICGSRLSQPVTIQSGKDPSVPLINLKGLAPPTPEGIAHKSFVPIQRSFGERKEALDLIPQIWMSPADVLDLVGFTKKQERLGGCCGAVGLNGPNRVCRCGAEIGTLQNDCFTAHIFIPLPDTTTWIESE